MDTHPGTTAYAHLYTPEDQTPAEESVTVCGWNAVVQSELSLNEYQRQSMRTVPPDAGPIEQLSSYGLGIAGEAGEVADLLKKILHHGHPLDADMRQRLNKELGDVLWYVQGISHVLGFTLEEVAQTNIDKLKARYPNGWTSEDSINRAQDDK